MLMKIKLEEYEFYQFSDNSHLLKFREAYTVYNFCLMVMSSANITHVLKINLYIIK